MFLFNQIRFKEVVNTGAGEQKRYKIFFTVIYTIDGESKEEPFVVKEDGNFESKLYEELQKYVDIYNGDGLSKGMSNAERIRVIQAIEVYVMNIIKHLGFPSEQQKKNV